MNMAYNIDKAIYVVECLQVEEKKNGVEIETSLSLLCSPVVATDLQRPLPTNFLEPPVDSIFLKKFLSLSYNFKHISNQSFSPEIPTNGQMTKANFHVLLFPSF